MLGAMARIAPSTARHAAFNDKIFAGPLSEPRKPAMRQAKSQSGRQSEARNFVLARQQNLLNPPEL
jgi:hypothetical protein